MSKEDTVPVHPDPRPPENQTELVAFVDKCIALGLTSLGTIQELLSDKPLSSKIIIAETHEALRGLRVDAELLEQELRAQAKLMESKDYSLNNGKGENR